MTVRSPRRWFVVQAMYETMGGTEAMTKSKPMSQSEAGEVQRELAETGTRTRIVEVKAPRRQAMTAKQRAKLQGELDPHEPGEGAHDTKNARK